MRKASNVKRQLDSELKDKEVERKNKAPRVDAEAQGILQLIADLGKQADDLIGPKFKKLAAASLKTGGKALAKTIGIEIPEEAINKMVTMILNIADKVVNWMKNQAYDFIVNNPWTCLAGIVGVGISCAYLLPGCALATEFLSFLGVSKMTAAGIAASIIGSGGVMMLIKHAFPLFESVANYFVNHCLEEHDDNPAITQDTLDITATVFGKHGIALGKS